MIQIVYGNEPYGIAVKRRKIKEGVDSLNLSLFSGGFTEEVLQVCKSYPFLADRKVIILDSDSLKDLDTKVFEDYLKEPVETTDLFISVKNIDKRLKLFKKVSEYIICCDKVSLEGFDKTILYETKKRGGSITLSALDLFRARINYDGVEDMTLVKAVSYLQNCLDYSGGEITEAVVDKIVPAFREGNAFILAPYIMSKDIRGYRKSAELLKVSDAIGTASAILRELRIAYKEHFFSDSEINARKPSVFKGLSSNILLSMMEDVTSSISGVKTGLVEDKELLNLIGNMLIRRVS